VLGAPDHTGVIVFLWFCSYCAEKYCAEKRLSAFTAKRYSYFLDVICYSVFLLLSGCDLLLRVSVTL